MRKEIKKGHLYWFYLDGPDIEKFFLVRAFRKFGIYYIPFSLRFYDRLYLREDHSKYSRLLVNYCKKKGIETFVVQEGFSAMNPTGHLPLYADQFLCPPECYQDWIGHGMEKGRVRIYHRSKPAQEYKGIVFLLPINTREDYLHMSYWNFKNVKVVKAIFRFMREDVVFKLHNKNREIAERIIPKNRIVEGHAHDLIKKYEKI